MKFKDIERLNDSYFLFQNRLRLRCEFSSVHTAFKAFDTLIPGYTAMLLETILGDAVSVL